MSRNRSKNIMSYIPGFRSYVTWKKIIATFYYLSCIIIMTKASVLDGLSYLSLPFIVFYTYDFLSRKDIRRHIPGFRSNTTWKKVIAYSYYLMGLIGLVSSITGLKDNKTGIFGSLVLNLFVMLIYYWPITIYNIYLLLKGEFRVEKEVTTSENISKEEMLKEFYETFIGNMEESKSEVDDTNVGNIYEE